MYTSFRLGGAKPEPWLWQALAGRHGASIEDVAHIGDQLTADVYGTLCARRAPSQWHRGDDLSDRLATP